MMQRLGNVTDTEMFRTFNMGIGMMVICSDNDADSICVDVGECHEIGQIVKGEKAISIN